MKRMEKKDKRRLERVEMNKRAEKKNTINC